MSYETATEKQTELAPADYESASREGHPTARLGVQVAAMAMCEKVVEFDQPEQNAAFLLSTETTLFDKQSTRAA